MPKTFHQCRCRVVWAPALRKKVCDRGHCPTEYPRRTVGERNSVGCRWESRRLDVSGYERGCRSILKESQTSNRQGGQANWPAIRGFDGSPIRIRNVRNCSFGARSLKYRQMILLVSGSTGASAKSPVASGHCLSTDPPNQFKRASSEGIN